MQARIKWVEAATFLAESGSGHTVVMDGPPEAGGRNLGIRPMEMMLIGLGGCATFDVVSILKKQRQQVRDCEMRLDAERADSEPKVFTKITVTLVVRGHQLKESAVKRAVELSRDKYCSASIMLKEAGVDFEYRHEIEEVAAP